MLQLALKADHHAKRYGQQQAYQFFPAPAQMQIQLGTSEVQRDGCGLLLAGCVFRFRRRILFWQVSGRGADIVVIFYIG